MDSDWRSDLDTYFSQTEHDTSHVQAIAAQEDARVEQFLTMVALPALEEIKAELEKHGRQVTLGSDAQHVSIKIVYQDRTEFDYSLHGRTLRIYPVETLAERGNTFNAEGSLRSDSKDYTVRDMTKTELIQHCLKAYRDSRFKVAWGSRSHGRQ